jgi:catechol 2,3-dioxygenase-like lactoylglutathione lyase family enzyme
MIRRSGPVPAHQSLPPPQNPRLMLFTEVAFTAYPAPDIAASRAFYEGILGLVPIMAEAVEGEGYWVEYELGPHTLAIGQAPGWEPNADGPNCGLEAVDFDATIAKLKAADVPFRMGPFETPVCHMAMVSDPAGNTLIIHKRKPGHS